MAHYDVQQVIENIERLIDEERDGEATDSPLRARERRLREVQRSLFRKLEGTNFRTLREYHAVDRVPEGTRFGFLKKILGRFLRLVSAPQAVYNWSNLQTLEAMAYELDRMRDRMSALEAGPARPIGMSRMAGAETTRLRNVIEQHLNGLQEHVGHMTSNMEQVGQAMTRMLDNMNALSARLSNLSTNQRNSATDMAAARLDISRLWTELGLVYESLDTRAEDLWRGLDERDLQLGRNTEAVQQLHGQVSSFETASKELRARLLVLTEQLAIQQEMLENLQNTVRDAPAVSPVPRKKAEGQPAQKPEAFPISAGLEEVSSASDTLIHRQLDLAYVRFQRQYRGDEDELRSRQKGYIELLEERLYTPGEERTQRTLKLLDVACGDGVFVELAKQNGWEARGVDLNESMVKQAKSRGIPIVQADALAYLEELEPKSVDAITAFQFVEHLTPWQIMKLLKSTYRVLRPGGVVLLETINPHTLKALHWYHFDLTHERLIFPEMLQLLAETAGFGRADWKGINPVAEEKRLRIAGSELEKENLQKLNAILFGDQDYYLLAHRAGSG